MNICEEVGKLLEKVKKENPLVHHITNYVTVNDCANIVLSLGGSPVMADHIEEATDMTSIANALVLNIGTISENSIDSMIVSGKRANRMGIPVILDPVGIGATRLRFEVINKILSDVKIAVIKGNFSEIKKLYGMNVESKGVDSLDSIEDDIEGAKNIAKELSKKLNSVIAITGKKDLITDGEKVITIDNGASIMSSVTGTGCMGTSLIGTYSAVTKDYFLSAVAGVLTMGIAGEIASSSLNKERLEGPGTFKTRLMDAIYYIDKDILNKHSKIKEL